MNKPPSGMPGIGGSLGICCVCGNNFLMEILLGTKVAEFELDGIENTLFAHLACRKKLREGMDFSELPPESPLRQAVESHNSGKP